jgi:hypothetical protein
VVVDGVVPDDTCAAAIDEVEAIDRSAYTWQDTRRIRKGSVHDLLAAGPAVRELAAACSDDATLTALRALTGIADLAADPGLAFAGIYVTPPGGWHRLHADFPRHPATRRWNRVALLLYLSDWRPGDGGELELWRPGGRAPGAVVQPRRGRMVVFECTSQALHAVATVAMRSPARVAIGMRYYSEQAPALAPRPLRHQTVRRPGERRIDVLPTAAEVVAGVLRIRALRRAQALM